MGDASAGTTNGYRRPRTRLAAVLIGIVLFLVLWHELAGPVTGDRDVDHVVLGMILAAALALLGLRAWRP